ncbi:MAG: ABC transporter substrate-binding protein [Alphaproteobacteria bacterium]|nr:ABC transporter substrate-binding protein [Alphaproteobacteria bacterium]
MLRLIAFSLCFIAFAAQAADAPDPTVARIEKFHDALLATMKQGEALGTAGRYKKLEPEVEAAFDLATMTKFTVGPPWAKMTEDERKSLIAAFRRMTIASYAHNFDVFKGQKFVTNPKVEARDPDRLVKSQVVPEGEKPVNLTYRMRQVGGEWKVIDVIYEFVSQLATRRSDFAATVASGGAPALVKKLDEISDKLMKSKGRSADR